MPRTKRILTASIRTHITDSEKTLLQSRADACSTSLSEWARHRLLEAAQFGSDTLRVLQQAYTMRGSERGKEPDAL